MSWVQKFGPKSFNCSCSCKYGKRFTVERYWRNFHAAAGRRYQSEQERNGRPVRKPKIPVPSTYFITTPIYYLNAAPHIGHLFSTVLADVIARWYGMLGAEVLFSTGTDEHGLKVQQAAQSHKQEPVVYCDAMSAQFKALFSQGSIDYTRYIRTTEEEHKGAVSALWDKLQRDGYIYKGSYEGWYCISDEAYLTDDQVVETVDKNGKTQKVSKESGNVVEWTKENNYLFRLSAFTKPLTEWIGKRVITPENFEPIVRQCLAEGLPDLSVSRPRSRISWGIPVPGDDSQTIYVWLDALTNYLTVGGYPQSGHQWPADCHVVGKDILRFHAVYWPAFLMAAGLQPPRKILCHSHWLMNKEKMSKSRGNVVSPSDRLAKFSSDGLRYYLMKDAALHSDGNYSDERAVECINTDLVNTLCNLVSRCSARSVNRKQLFPCFRPDVFARLATNAESDVFDNLYQLADEVDEGYRSFTITRALESTMYRLYRANSFVEHHRPWDAVKSDSADRQDDVQCVIHVGLETARVAALALSPVTPLLSRKILERLGTYQNGGKLEWSDMVAPCKVDRPLGADVGPLLPRIRL